jgi:hypothetical protein
MATSSKEQRGQELHLVLGVGLLAEGIVALAR